MASSAEGGFPAVAANIPEEHFHRLQQCFTDKMELETIRANDSEQDFRSTAIAKNALSTLILLKGGSLVKSIDLESEDIVQRTKLCRSELPANGVLHRHNAPRLFLFLPRVSV
ncbi:hypothetical protein EVAR_3839_1 [Eumeta japonica]|uniref:Uncharacterized protein n=1 Tax=Eumeta variegata TaxID=151549 RepID=A0A4C1SSZ0_EUMVA|nr:hypothetical protein EVAR_3839_1 [Eumeta japonica]